MILKKLIGRKLLSNLIGNFLLLFCGKLNYDLTSLKFRAANFNFYIF